MPTGRDNQLDDGTDPDDGTNPDDGTDPSDSPGRAIAEDRPPPEPNEPA